MRSNSNFKGTTFFWTLPPLKGTLRHRQSFPRKFRFSMLRTAFRSLLINQKSRMNEVIVLSRNISSAGRLQPRNAWLIVASSCSSLSGARLPLALFVPAVLTIINNFTLLLPVVQAIAMSMKTILIIRTTNPFLLLGAKP